MKIINGVNKIRVGDVIHIKGFLGGYDALIVMDRHNGMKCAIDQYCYMPVVFYLQHLKQMKHKLTVYRPNWVKAQPLDRVQEWQILLSRCAHKDTKKSIPYIYSHIEHYEWEIESVKKAIKTKQLIEV